jgi:hypothetical protein
VGVVGVLLLPPLLPLFVVEFGTPDMGVGVWLLSEEVGDVPGCAVEVGLGVVAVGVAPGALVGVAVGFGVGFGVGVLVGVGEGEGEGVIVLVGDGVRVLVGVGVGVSVGVSSAAGMALDCLLAWRAVAAKDVAFTRASDMSMSMRQSVAAITRARGRTLWSPTLFDLLSMCYNFPQR